MSAPVSAIGRVMQLGVESVENTGVACDKKFQAIGFELQPEVTTDEQWAQGYYFPTSVVPLLDYTTGNIVGRGSYNELAYLFSSLLAYSAPVQQAATIAYLQTFTPSVAAADTHKTYTVEDGFAGAGNARKVTGLYVNEVSLAMSRASGIEVGGSVVGRQLQIGQTLTATPTAIPFVPIIPTGVSIYADATWAGLGTTKLLDNVSVNWSLGNRFQPWWTLNAAVPSMAGKVNSKPSTSVEIMAAANSAEYAYLTTLRAAGTIFLRVEAIGPLIVAGHFYSFFLDMALQFSGGAGVSNDNDALVLSKPMTIVQDATSGKAMEIRLKNTLVTL